MGYKPQRIVKMELMECINGRRSIRSYLDKPVEKEKIEGILNAGIQAPSAMNGQPWKFTVITDRKKIGGLSDKTKKNLDALGMGLRVAEMMKIKEDIIFYGAPLLIVISAKKDDKWQKIDCGLAAQNMFLAAYGMGLGSCYIGFACSLNNDPEALKDLGVPKGCEIVAPLIFGYPKAWPKPKERKLDVVKRIV